MTDGTLVIKHLTPQQLRTALNGLSQIGLQAEQPSASARGRRQLTPDTTLEEGVLYLRITLELLRTTKALWEVLEPIVRQHFPTAPPRDKPDEGVQFLVKWGMWQPEQP